MTEVSMFLKLLQYTEGQDLICSVDLCAICFSNILVRRLRQLIYDR